MLYFLTITFGLLIGLALGLTGGGGSIFAVPLLVYGLSVDPREAVGVSLAAVGATSAIGFVQRWRRGEAEVGTGLLFALLGMLGAPVGTWMNRQIPETWLMVLFAGLMFVVAVRMWLASGRMRSWKIGVSARQDESCAEGNTDAQNAGPTCRRDVTGVLHLTSRCALLLAILGFITGVLAGLFGVGGGFVIVPALVLFSQMEMRHAVGTSLLVIALVSASGVTSYWLSGRELSPLVTVGFITGGVLGLFLATGISRRLSGPRLQKVFAGMIVGVAAFVVTKNLILTGGV